MKKRGNLRKRLTALLLSACVALGAVPVYQYNTVEAEAGLKAFVGDKLADLAVETIDRAIVYGLEEASNDDTTGLNILISFMHSPEENKLEALQELCEEILYDVEILMKEVNVIAAQNQEILLELSQQTMDQYNQDIVDFSNTYSAVYQDYLDVIEAMQTYAEDPTDVNLVAVQAKLVPLQTFYENCKDGTINLTNDITGYASDISVYQASSTIQSEDEWVLTNSKTSYLTAFIQYTENLRVSQEQVHDDVEVALNYVTTPFYYYLFCLNLYTTMDLYNINADTSLTASERQVQLTAANDLQEKLQNYGYNAVNQAAYQCEEILTTYRSMDDEDATTIAMAYYADYHEAWQYDHPGQFAEDTYYFYGTPVKTNGSMEVSFVTALDGTTYAIRTDGGENPSLTAGDLTATYTVTCVHHTHYASVDFANMLNGSGSWSSLHLVYSADDLDPLLTQGSYYLCENNLIYYLRDMGENENIFSSVRSDEMMLTSHYWSPSTSTGYGRTRMAELDPYDLYSGAEEVEDNSNELYKRDDETMSVWIYYFQDGNDAVSYTCKVTDGDGGSSILTEKDSSQEMENSNGTYSVLSGESYTLKVKPDDGYTAVSAVMYKYDSAGEKVEVKNYDLSGMKDVQSPDEDGYYSVTTYASPYRDVVWEITYEEETEGSYLVTLDQPSISEASIQFSSTPGIDSAYFTSGTDVVIYVRPESHYLSAGITVTTVSGETVDVLEADDSQMILACGENTVGYVFTMPEEDVTVTASLGTGYEVSLTTRGGGSGSLYFTDSYGKALGSTGTARTAVSGSNVYIRAEAESGSHLSSLLVQGATSQINYNYTDKNGLITITVPDDEDLIVTGTFVESNSFMDTVEVMTSGSGSVTFQNVASGTEGLSTHDFLPGRTVTILAKPVEGGEIESVTVTDTEGTALAGVNIEIYEDDVNCRLITFTMQNYKVIVTVDFQPFTEFTVESDENTAADIYLLDGSEAEYLFSAPAGASIEEYLEPGNYRAVINSQFTEPAVSLSENGGSASSLTPTVMDGDGAYYVDFTVEESDTEMKLSLSNYSVFYVSTAEELCEYADLMNGTDDTAEYYQ
ncbi:MAG: hypothetical protein LUE14_00910 [Clostridiales bacterium]|nr:hypothetical protein [Clostridiales bacterium]